MEFLLAKDAKVISVFRKSLKKTPLKVEQGCVQARYEATSAAGTLYYCHKHCNRKKMTPMHFSLEQQRRKDVFGA